MKRPADRQPAVETDVVIAQLLRDRAAEREGLAGQAASDRDRTVILTAARILTLAADLLDPDGA